jgi:hypothetical protein
MVTELMWFRIATVVHVAGNCGVSKMWG